jgi:hypothetical protein
MGILFSVNELESTGKEAALVWQEVLGGSLPEGDLQNHEIGQSGKSVPHLSNTHHLPLKPAWSICSFIFDIRFLRLNTF